MEITHEPKEIVGIVEKSDEFQTFKKKNKEAYLVHIFKIFDPEKEDVWQIGYTSNRKEVTSFVLKGSEITVLPKEKVFQEKEHDIKELNLEDVTASLDAALKAAEKFQKEKASDNPPMKVMVVLQKIASQTVYNITYITRAFNTLNMKFSASDLTLISHEITPLLNFRGKAS